MIYVLNNSYPAWHLPLRTQPDPRLVPIDLALKPCRRLEPGVRVTAACNNRVSRNGRTNRFTRLVAARRQRGLRLSEP